MVKNNQINNTSVAADVSLALEACQFCDEAVQLHLRSLTKSYPDTSTTPEELRLLLDQEMGDATISGVLHSIRDEY